jgi:hypothetical protein
VCLVVCVWVNGVRVRERERERKEKEKKNGQCVSKMVWTRSVMNSPVDEHFSFFARKSKRTIITSVKSICTELKMLFVDSLLIGTNPVPGVHVKSGQFVW